LHVTRGIIVFAGRNNATFERHELALTSAQEMLVKTRFSAVSKGTERMWLQGTATALRSGRKNYPYYPGYSCVAEVVALGSDAEGFEEGDLLFCTKSHASHHLMDPKRELAFKLSRGVSESDVLLRA